MAIKAIHTSNQKDSKPKKLAENGFIRIMPLAEFLGIHHQTVRRWVRENQMPKPKTINGIIVFDNSEIHEWLKSQTA